MTETFQFENYVGFFPNTLVIDVYLQSMLRSRRDNSLDFHIWLSLLSLILGIILSNHSSSNKCNIVQM
jgi:inner membrane protein involved in colicin E2 resistance